MLVVDDIYDNAILLADLLAPLNANVVAARSVGEALTIVDAQVVELVVTDLNMPGGSGLDLARDLRRRRHPPAVIFLTASTLAADKVAAFELGAAAYLQKPVDCAYLTRLARQISVRLVPDHWGRQGGKLLVGDGRDVVSSTSI